MGRVFVTGSTQGLGRATALALLAQGQQVVVHARDQTRAGSLQDLAALGAHVVVGDLASLQQTVDVADQVDALGRMDAIVHNAGVFGDAQRFPTAEGHPRTLAVNVLAPYLLTALMQRPERLVYLSSGMHRSGDPTLRDLDWTARRWNSSQAYSDSKLYVTTLAFALARRYPQIRSNAVDPGWVPTRMGGPGAPDDLAAGHLTQVQLATGDPAVADVSGQLWYHQRPQRPAPASGDPDFQDRLLEALTEMTGVALP